MDTTTVDKLQATLNEIELEIISLKRKQRKLQGHKEALETTISYIKSVKNAKKK